MSTCRFVNHKKSTVAGGTLVNLAIVVAVVSDTLVSVMVESAPTAPKR